MKKWSMISLLSLLLGACAKPPPALHVRASDRASLEQMAAGQPVVVEFQEGDVIPLRVFVGGPLAETDPSTPPVVVRVKRRFFLWLDQDTMKVSLDGEHFDPPRGSPGKFSFGLGVNREGPQATMSLVTPAYTP